MSKGVVAPESTEVPKTSTHVRVLGDRVLVYELDADTQTKSGILIPDIARQGTQRGLVIATGPGPRSPFTGEVVDMGLRAGDHVMFAQMAGQEMTVDGEQLLVLRESDIICVFSAEPADDDGAIDGQLEFEGGTS